MQKNKGFTFIELLVVIAVIGILATIVIVLINDVNNKGANTSLKSNLKQALNQAEFLSTKEGSYKSVCPDNGFQDSKMAGIFKESVKYSADSDGIIDGTQMLSFVSKPASPTTAICHTNFTSGYSKFVFQFPLKSKEKKIGESILYQYWCVDSSGFNGLNNTPVSAIQYNPTTKEITGVSCISD